MTITLPRPLAAALALGALALTSSAAFASSHPVGPYTKAQTYAICDNAHGQRTAGPAQWGCDAQRFAIACTEAGKLCMIDLFGTLADGTAQPRVTTAAVIGGDTGPSGTGGTGGTGGGLGSIGGEKVDTSGLSIGRSYNFGDGNTITTDGDHHGYGGPLH